MSKPAWTISTDPQKPKSRSSIPTYEVGQLVRIVDGLEQADLTNTYGIVTSLDKTGRPVMTVKTRNEPVSVNGWDVLWKRVTEEEMTEALLWGKST